MALQHPVFEGPFPVVLDRVTVDRPTNYDHYFEANPLPARIDAWQVQQRVTGPDGRGLYGSVAVDCGFEDAPDGERISGGINTKGPDWVAIGRHGNFLQWGFCAPPSELTPSGRAVLLNCIVYMAQFDRVQPLHKRRFIGRDWWIDQAVQFRDLEKEHARLTDLATSRGHAPDSPRGYGTFAEFVAKRAARTFPDLHERLGADLEAYLPAMLENRAYLFARGSEFAPPRIDEDCRALRIANHDPELLDRCIADLDGAPSAADRDRAQRVLERYTGLALGSAGAWRAWLDEVRDGLYFSDTGGYRFFSTIVSSVEAREQITAADASDEAAPADGPVSLSALLVADPAATDRATIVVRARIREGWHIYANLPEGSPYRPTRFELELPDGVRAIDDWALPQATPMLDAPDQLVWEGDVVFRRRIEGPPARLAQPITVTVDYQSCDANLCEPPAEVDVPVRRGAGR